MCSIVSRKAQPGLGVFSNQSCLLEKSHGHPERVCFDLLLGRAYRKLGWGGSRAAPRGKGGGVKEGGGICVNYVPVAEDLCSMFPWLPYRGITELK